MSTYNYEVLYDWYGILWMTHRSKEKSRSEMEKGRVKYKKSNIIPMNLIKRSVTRSPLLFY